jgi:hypothetical protein
MTRHWWSVLLIESVVVWANVKISHDDEEVVVTAMLSMLYGRFGKDTPLSIDQQKVHKYLGITINFGLDGKVQFCMDDYVNGIMGETPEELSGTAKTPLIMYVISMQMLSS